MPQHLCVVLFLVLCAQCAGKHVHVITIATKASPELVPLYHSANKNKLFPRIVGLGKEAWWPDGLGSKINLLRDFLLDGNVPDEDLVLVPDAYGVIIVAGEAEIIKRFDALGHAIVFGAELSCYEGLGCTASRFPPSPTKWKYLNSGAFIGTAKALRVLLKDRVSDIMPHSDQGWYLDQFLDNGKVGGRARALDTVPTATRRPPTANRQPPAAHRSLFQALETSTH
jgi:hypothetical protein